MCVSSACLSLSANYYLSACLLALAPQPAAPCCLSVAVHHHCRPQWTRGRHACCFRCCFFQPALHCHCLPVCVTALPCLALLDRTCRARESTLSPAHSDRHSRTQPVSQSVSQVTLSCTTTVCLSVSCSTRQRLQQPPRQSHQLAQALISPTCCRLFCSLAAAACDLLDLAASATVSAPSPCDAAANNNNATASDQPFACGRPIHLATSSPNKRADYCSSLA